MWHSLGTRGTLKKQTRLSTVAEVAMKGDASKPVVASGDPARGFGQLWPSLLTRGKLKGREPNKLSLPEGGWRHLTKLFAFHYNNVV